MIPSKKLMQQILLGSSSFSYLLLGLGSGTEPCYPSDRHTDPPTLQYEEQLDRSFPFRSPLQSSSIGADTLKYEGALLLACHPSAVATWLYAATREE